MDENYIDDLAKKSMETPRKMEFDESAWEQLAGRMDIATATATAGGGAAALGSTTKVSLIKSLIIYAIAATLFVAIGVLGWQLSEVSNENGVLREENSQLKITNSKEENSKLQTSNSNPDPDRTGQENSKSQIPNSKKGDSKFSSTDANKEINKSAQAASKKSEPSLYSSQLNQLNTKLKQAEDKLKVQLAINRSLIKENAALVQSASSSSLFLDKKENAVVAENKLSNKETQAQRAFQNTDIQPITDLATVALSLKLKAFEAALLPDIEISPLPRSPKEFKRLSLGYHIDNVKLGTVAISGSSIRGAASVKSKGFKFEYRIFPSLSLSGGTESRNDTYEFLRNSRPRGSRNGDKLQPWEPTHTRQKTSINLYSTAFPIALKYNLFPRSFVSPWVQAGLILSQSERQHIAVEFRPPSFPGRPQRPNYTREHTDEERKLYLSTYRLGAGVDVEIVPSFILQASMSLDQRIKALRPRFERKGEQQAQLAILYRF